MFEEAIRYPWKGEERVETVAIGGLLSLFSFLILPTFVVYGYLVRVIRRVSEGDDEVPPVFDDYEELLVDGLKAFVVMFVYSLVSFGVVAIALASLILPVSFREGPAGPSSLNVLGLVFALVVIAVAVLASLGAAYFVPAAVAAFARTGRLGAAFSPSELRSVGTHRGYAVAWLVALAVTILASVVGGAVSMTVLGALLVPFVAFYGAVSAAYTIGKGVAGVHAPEKRDSAPATGGSTA